MPAPSNPAERSGAAKSKEEEQAEVEAKEDTMADAVLVLLVAMANS